MDRTLPIQISQQIENSVEYFKLKQNEFKSISENLLNALISDNDFSSLIHSTKMRTKDPDHLRDKLKRIAIEAATKNKAFEIDKDNLFTKIDDLAGIRLLHLHTRQISQIHKHILDFIVEHKHKLINRKPIAYTWDFESKQYYKDIGLRPKLNSSFYTSVHYVVEVNRMTKMRCEIQVRTLIEEVWGEVSHTINYPHETSSLSCREQLKALARVASGCTRLVDSIFSSHEDYLKNQKDDK